MADSHDASKDDPDNGLDDVKARFKEALERKQGQHRNERLHPDSDSKVHEPHGRSGGKREFRRKSGG
jgi:hypothetical protein